MSLRNENLNKQLTNFIVTYNDDLKKSYSDPACKRKHSIIALYHALLESPEYSDFELILIDKDTLIKNLYGITFDNCTEVSRYQSFILHDKKADIRVLIDAGSFSGTIVLNAETMIQNPEKQAICETFLRKATRFFENPLHKTLCHNFDPTDAMLNALQDLMSNRQPIHGHKKMQSIFHFMLIPSDQELRLRLGNFYFKLLPDNTTIFERHEFYSK